MVAVVRGERRPASRSSRTAPPAKAQGRRPKASRDLRLSSRPASAGSGGLGPRLALAVGALVILGGAAAGLVLAHRDHPADGGAASSPIDRALASLGFRLQRVEVQGAPDMARTDILRAANLAKDAPITGIDLNALRQRVEGTGWVKEAKVVRLLPDTIVIAVVPRTPAAVWQHLGQTRVVDLDGQVIGGADPGRFPALPLVVGEGAAGEAHDILPLLRQRPRLMSLVDALVRVDGRRWDLRLKDGAIIELPAVGADSALIQLDQLDQKQRILSLGFERIDLRDPDAIAVRPRPAAPGIAPAAAEAGKH